MLEYPSPTVICDREQIQVFKSQEFKLEWIQDFVIDNFILYGFVWVYICHGELHPLLLLSCLLLCIHDFRIDVEPDTGCFISYHHMPGTPQAKDAGLIGRNKKCFRCIYAVLSCSSPVLHCAAKSAISSGESCIHACFFCQIKIVPLGLIPTI